MTHTSHWEINAFDDEAWCVIENYIEKNRKWEGPDFNLDNYEVICNYITTMTTKLFNNSLKFKTKKQCLDFIQDAEWLEKVYAMVLNDLTADEIGEAKDIVSIFNLCWNTIGRNMIETYAFNYIYSNKRRYWGQAQAKWKKFAYLLENALLKKKYL
jgi:hypothetical protein